MKIQIISDVHLEFYQSFPRIKKNPGVEIVCLLGDIGYPTERNYRDFLIYLSGLFRVVIVIAGNHEYYNVSKKKEEVDNYINDKVVNIENIHFLNNSTYNLEK